MKKTRLTFSEWWMWKVTGRRFIVNLNTLEIHDLSNKKNNCLLNVMASKNKVYAGTQTILGLLDGQYNGCRHCMEKYDRG